MIQHNPLVKQTVQTRRVQNYSLQNTFYFNELSFKYLPHFLKKLWQRKMQNECSDTALLLIHCQFHHHCKKKHVSIHHYKSFKFFTCQLGLRLLPLNTQICCIWNVLICIPFERSVFFVQLILQGCVELQVIIHITHICTMQVLPVFDFTPWTIGNWIHMIQPLSLIKKTIISIASGRH